MQLLWLQSVCQCVVSVCVIGVSVRLCLAGGRNPALGRGVTRCLCLCVGWVGAVGGAVEIPVSVVLNLRSPQCLYTCLILVSWPLLVRQFTMCLLLLLTLNSHLQQRLGGRYTSFITWRRALFVLLFGWVASVLTAFSQFIFWNVLDTWEGTTGLGLQDERGENRTTSSPPVKLPRPQDLSVIGSYLPYGGFLSKFYVKDPGNFTYAEIHGSHWGFCAPDTVLRPQFLVYVYALTVFLVPLLVLMGVYLDLMCGFPKNSSTPVGAAKQHAVEHRSLGLSLSLLVLLCLPLHTSHALLLFAPGTIQPPWASFMACLLFQAYGLVPPLVHTAPTPRVTHN
ncbi:adenosine receptor A1-like [Arapaima gigas]